MGRPHIIGARESTHASARSTPFSATVRAGIRGGFAGAVLIWVYEALVWVGAQHLMPLAGIPRNTTGLVFGKGVQDSPGVLAYIVGTGIHLVFVLAWGVAFALI